MAARRVSLPTADDLFRPTAGAEEAEPEAPAARAVSAVPEPIPSMVDPTMTPCGEMWKPMEFSHRLEAILFMRVEEMTLFKVTTETTSSSGKRTTIRYTAISEPI